MPDTSLPPRTPTEIIKENSRLLRGTLAEGLRDVSTGAIVEDDTQLSKFHGIYLQDDRDQRPERRRKRMEKAYGFMVRMRIPGGRLTSAQWLALDRIADDFGNGTLRLTTRQAMQFHGIIKTNLRRSIRLVNEAILDTLAACGDVNRNVMSSANPAFSRAHAEAYDLALRVSSHLSPRTRAYHDVWLGDKKVHDGEGVATIDEDEPIYGRTYLPRKFKTVIAVPPVNDVDVFAHDLGFTAIVRKGAVVGYNVSVGGGMGMTHGEPDTYPRLADVIGFCTAEQVVDVAEKVVTIQRDWGDRSDRKHARLKYTIDRRGLDVFKKELEARLGYALGRARSFRFERTGDRPGWTRGEDGAWHYVLYVENGRIKNTPDWPAKRGLAEIARVHEGRFVITPNQNLVIGEVSEERKPEIDALLNRFGLSNDFSGLRLNAMACVALPTCGQALAEAERLLPDVVRSLEETVERAGLRDDDIVIRMTGCPNGCARPYLAEIGIVGKAAETYAVLLGGSFDGRRLNRLYRDSVAAHEIAPLVAPLIEAYARDRENGERFGDFVVRAGIVPLPTGAATEFHAPP